MTAKNIIIDGYETNYLISDDGTVKNKKTNRVLKGSITSEGYNRIQLSVNGKNKSILTHKLVAEYFLENPDNCKYIMHIDGNNSNNDVKNLAWTNSLRREITNITEKEKQKSSPYDWKVLNINSGYSVCKEGFVRNNKTGRILKGGSRCGYRRVLIDNKPYSVHRLVYETFVGPIPERMVIDHIDGNKENNNVENLRCITQSENMKHAYEMGHRGQQKIRQYGLDGKFIKEYPNLSVAAKEFNVTYRAIASAAERGGTSCGYYWEKV